MRFAPSGHTGGRSSETKALGKLWTVRRPRISCLATVSLPTDPPPTWQTGLRPATPSDPGDWVLVPAPTRAGVPAAGHGDTERVLRSLDVRSGDGDGANLPSTLAAVRGPREAGFTRLHPGFFGCSVCVQRTPPFCLKELERKQLPLL